MAEDDGQQISAGEFGVAFKGFLEQAAAQAPVQEPFFVARLKEFFGQDPRGFPIVSQEFPLRDHPSLQRSLDRYLNAEGRIAELVGVATANKSFNGVSLLELVSARGRPGLWGDGSPTPGPVEYVDLVLSEDEAVTAVKSGVILLEDGDGRLVILVSASGQTSPMRSGMRVEVMGPTREVVEACLGELRRGLRELNVYRGRVITLEQEQYAPITIRVQRLPEIERDGIVLPSGVLERVERHTITFAERVGQLRAAGQHAKRGLLLHGPPGTGKTLTAKYIAGQMPERTVVILTGAGLRLVDEACTIARLLQPSMLIAEDIDLIAEERTREHASPSLLFELLNQLDGMEEDADVIFLLTTNRPDLLEPALAARPGRVDLAVEIPLPDEVARRRLFELYSRSLSLDVQNLDHYVARTRGVSAAFIRELIRKAALTAADQTTPLRISDRDLDDALQELLFEGGELTRSLLGGSVSHGTV